MVVHTWHVASVHILITSDTHASGGHQLPTALLAAAESADQIVHAGDHSTLDVLRVLERFAPVLAVAGNVEHPEVTASLPERARQTVDGVAIGVVHDAGPTAGRHQRLRTWFEGCRVVVYGHSHMPEVTQLDDGLWIVNPGSPTQRRRSPFHSFVWMRIDRGVISVDLVEIENSTA